MCECFEWEDGDLYLCPVDADIHRELVAADKAGDSFSAAAFEIENAIEVLHRHVAQGRGDDLDALEYRLRCFLRDKAGR